MNEIKMLREFLGMTQKDMAAYLKISRTHLAMVERFDRQLSTKIYNRFLQLDRLRLEADQADLADEKKPASYQEEKVKKMDEMRERKTWRLKNLEQDHEHLRSEKNKVLKLLKVLKKTDPKDLDMHESQFNHIKGNAEKILRDSQERKEMDLEIRIELLKNELEFLKKKKKERQGDGADR